MRKQAIWTAGCWIVIGSFGLHHSAVVKAETIDCQATLQAEQSKLLALDFHNFDQTPQHGWRWLGEELKCYQEAAELIVRYLDTQPGLSANETEILSFHAGQMFALSNDYEAAIPYLRKGYQKLENITPTFRLEAKPYVDSWNAYVNATIAFLQQDKASLIRYRAIVARGPKMPDGKIMNLAVVDRLLKHFGKPYQQAFSER